MSEKAVIIEKISKRYQLGEYVFNRGSRTFRDIFDQKVKRLFSKKQDKDSKNNSVLWALDDVSLEIEEGEVVGIIGRNGAGKSTLLKILSKITEPTKGKITLYGRVGSLLEVGTGFSPELTGRENIYLNGSILGMSRYEINQKFNEIVAFAEVERFLDTPVKRYSSGMYVRLAFSVAAHLETEILIVDEVLAVGDAEFQRRCLGKMEEVGKQGRTVLFVSHNMNAVELLCNKAVILEKGKVKRIGKNVHEIVSYYLSGGAESSNLPVWKCDDHIKENEWFRIKEFSIVDTNDKIVQLPLRNNDELFFRFEIDIKQIDPALQIGYALYAEDGLLVYWSFHTDGEESNWPKLKIGKNILYSPLPMRLFNEGTYRVDFLAALYFREWVYEPGLTTISINFEVRGGLSDSPYWTVYRPGILAPVQKWTIEE